MIAPRGIAAGKTEKADGMKVLLAIDDSKCSEAAMQTVIEQGHAKETEVRVLHIVEPPSLLVARDMGANDSKLENVWEEEMKQGQVLVEKAAEKLRAHGMKVSTDVQQGDPKMMIIDESKKWHSDLIVVGSHGKKALDRYLMGSVSDTIARQAQCSVEIVRIPAHR